jgi:hypothetical protein
VKSLSSGVSLSGLRSLGYEFGNTELLDEGVEDLIAGLDVLDLDLRSLGDEIHLSLTLLFLESEGDTSDGTGLDSLHEMGGETGDLVSESLGLNDGAVIDDSFVGVEVVGELTVVLLDDSSGGSLDSLSSNATHGYIEYK